MKRTPGGIFIGAMLCTVGAQEVPAATNRGPFVELCQATGHGKPGDAWCADLVTRVGTTMFDAWPLPATGSVAEIVAFAIAHGLLVDTPEPGDLFAVWFDSLNRFAHIGGVVQQLEPRIIDSVSGNTTDPKVHVEGANSREGWCVSHRPWHLASKDCYIHWTGLLKEA